MKSPRELFRRLDKLATREGRRLPAETIFVTGLLAERYSRRARRLRRRFPGVFGKLDGKSWETCLATATRLAGSPPPGRLTPERRSTDP